MILGRSGQSRTGNHSYGSYKAFSFAFTSASVNQFLLLLYLVPCSLSCTPIERDSLLAFLSNLSSTSTPKAATFPSWGATRNPDCCLWDGVTCDSPGSVTRLQLPLRGLKGPISAAALQGLPSLTHLNLSRNSLTGELDPTLLWRTGLVVLDISGNRLDGQLVLTGQQLPPTAGRRSPLRLRTVDLSNNRFSGPLLPSTWWASAPDLVSVNASNNRFTGTIPSSAVCAANRLQVLDVSINQLEGSIPLGFGNCSQLTLLRLGSNQFSGQLPPDLYDAVSLQELSAPSNNISGDLDAQGKIANLTNLSLLDLSYNLLNGSVPEGIGKLANLEVLMLNNNQLSGSLPLTLTNCTKLTLLNLRINQLSGEMSAIDFSKLSKLQTLDLGYNNFTGTLPPTIYECKSLVALRLAKNNLTGRINPEMAGLQALSFISLSANHLVDIDMTFKILQQIKNLTVVLLAQNFHGESMPQGITGFQSLQMISLRECQLAGQVPTWLSSMRNLAFLDLSINRLTGTVPSWLGSLRHLFSLDLSANLLTGDFPVQLTELPALTSEEVVPEVNQTLLPLPVFFNTYNYNGSGLQYNRLSNMPRTLNLQKNHLTGVIPPRIGLLKIVQVLKLNNNSFSGNIPSEIGKLTSLQTLDLSFNRLEGEIPAELSNLNFLSEFSVSHNQLWGPIPQGGQFSTFNFSSFYGNPGLCTNDTGHWRSCTSAGQPSTRKRINKKLLILLILGVFGGAFVFILFLLLCLPLRRTKHAETLDSLNARSNSDRSMPCFPQDDELASCGPIVLFPQNCEIKRLTISDILHATSNFDNEYIIGCGGFGLVYKCALPAGPKLAIKRLIGDTGIMEREFKAEVETLSTARHENLVPLAGYFMHKNFRLLIYSLMENGSLDDWLHERADGPSLLNWPLRLHIAQGASQGLSYIHQTCKPHIVHRDIKSSNILLDGDLRAHIADFGLSRLILPTNTHVTTELVGTPGYIPPEYGQAWTATLRGDIYSLGVVLLELLTGRRPYNAFNHKQERELVGWVQEMGTLGKHEEVFDPLLRGRANEEQMIRVLDIASLCVSQDPLKRPVIQDVVNWLHHVEATHE